METSPPARAARLTPAAEGRLLAFFALQDTLTREDLVALARQVLLLDPAALSMQYRGGLSNVNMHTAAESRS